jgi:hypothetical protein
VELIIARRYVTRIAPLTIRDASFKIAFMFLWAGLGGKVPRSRVLHVTSASSSAAPIRQLNLGKLKWGD